MVQVVHLSGPSDPIGAYTKVPESMGMFLDLQNSCNILTSGGLARNSRYYIAKAAILLADGSNGGLWLVDGCTRGHMLHDS